MHRFNYIDANTHEVSGSLQALFPEWKGASENVCVYSPHDDDAAIGAGYAMRAALEDGASVHVFIICSGNAGYSNVCERDTIVDIRRRETIACYEALGIPMENILFFNISDFSALSKIGWDVAPNQQGHFRKAITELRTRKITRVLVPNHYREHIDHLAANIMASYDAPQSGDAFAVDWATPNTITSVAQYAVWADLDPEDAILNGRPSDVRANCIMMVSEDVETTVCKSIMQYTSQKEIICGLLQARKDRMTDDGRYIEVYMKFDPRPKLDFSPYKTMIKAVLGQ